MQHPFDSAMESLVNVVIAFGISMAMYAFVINPLFGLHTTPSGSFGIVGLFTVTSLARQFVLRRMFNGRSAYAYFKEARA